jgi:lysophospholipase L1-like esterase
MFGDSTTATAYNVWPALMISHLNNDHRADPKYFVCNSPGNAAISGYTVAQTKSSIDSWITGYIYDSNKLNIFLISLGLNDCHTPLPDAATWKANYQYIIDALKTKYPNAVFFLSKIWGVGRDANAATMAGWVDDLVAATPAYVFAGDDEQVWKKGDDDGATMTSDGTHLSDAGQIEKEAQENAIIEAYMTSIGL